MFEYVHPADFFDVVKRDLFVVVGVVFLYGRHAAANRRSSAFAPRERPHGAAAFRVMEKRNQWRVHQKKSGDGSTFLSAKENISIRERTFGHLAEKKI